MGESDRHIEYKDKYGRPGLNFNINSPVILLICINFTVFLFTTLLKFGNTMGDTAIAPFFYNKLNSLLVSPGFKDLLKHPWSLLTYGFFHIQFFTLASNMIWLWGFGTILQTIGGNKRIFPVYIYGVIAGAVAFIFAARMKGVEQVYPLYGANAAVMAVAVAATALAPDYRLFQHIGKGLPLWILTAVYIIIDLVGMGTATMPFYAAHLAGAFIGFLFIYFLHRGSDWGAWMESMYNWFNNLFNPAKKAKASSIKEKVFYNTGKRNPYSKTSNVTQQRVDEILDKISQQGFSALNKEEKDILKRASEE